MKPSLHELAAAARAHYRDARIQWPDEAQQRTFHVTTAQGRHQRIPGPHFQPAKVLAAAPLRIRYTARSLDASFLDVDLLVQSAAAASRIATAITEDLGADPGQVFILRETPNRYHVVASGPFRGASSSDVAGLLAYLEPRSFNASSHAGTGHQDAYQEYTAKRLQELAGTPSAALHEALARHPATRHDPHGAVGLLKQDLAPERLDEHPGLRRLVHEQALQHVFPDFDSKRSRGDPLIPLAGSLWAAKNSIVKRIEVHP